MAVVTQNPKFEQFLRDLEEQLVAKFNTLLSQVGVSISRLDELKLPDTEEEFIQAAAEGTKLDELPQSFWLELEDLLDQQAAASVLARMAPIAGDHLQEFYEICLELVRDTYDVQPDV